MSDSKVTVVITPVLNQMTRGIDDEEADLTLVGSYADPSVDLTTYDPEDNPISDEQEVITFMRQIRLVFTIQQR